MATGKDGYSPYRGVWVICLIMLIVPVPFIFLFKFALGTFPNSGEKELTSMGIMFGMIIGTLFDYSCILTGFLNSLVKEFFERLGILFKYLVITPKNALRLYFEELKENGGALWIYVLIIGFHTVYTIIAITSYISTYLIK